MPQKKSGIACAPTFAVIRLAALSVLIRAQPTQAQTSFSPGARQPTVLYGAAHYHEYMPADLQPGRLDKDVALMKEAGITVVRMGKSTWSLWQPGDGRFEYAWMDRAVNAMGKAGVKVIMGTPTYSIPTWMAQSHPEILAGHSEAIRSATACWCEPRVDFRN